MKLMSFAMTTPQILDRSKTVTRRIGWRFLKPGDLIQAVNKVMGFKKGEHPTPLAVIRIVDVRRERLDRMVTEPRYGHEEVRREGYPWGVVSAAAFQFQFERTHAYQPDGMITRIEFEYVEPKA